MRKLTILFLIIYISLPLHFGNDNSNQEWRKITPLFSNCMDVKEILGVKECEFPNSKYKFPKYRISITFSTGNDEWNVPKGTVLEIGVSLKELIKLDDYEKNLVNYKILPVDDLPDYRRYIDETNGIELLVTGNKLVQHIYMFPPKKQKNKTNRKM